jgi:hypothetical protein
MNERRTMTNAARRKKFEETYQIATSTIEAQRAAREEKTTRIRALRFAKKAEAAVDSCRSERSL